MSKNLSFEDATILFRNFKGEPDRYNKQGVRSFCVLVSSDRVDEVEQAGYNVKPLKARDEDDPPRFYLNVGVRFDIMPPKIVMISGGRKMMLDESKIDILDWAEIEKIDLTVRPYDWTMNARTGTKAYLKTMYVTIHEDEFEEKYRDYPDAE